MWNAPFARRARASLLAAAVVLVAPLSLEGVAQADDCKSLFFDDLAVERAEGELADRHYDAALAKLVARFWWLPSATTTGERAASRPDAVRLFSVALVRGGTPPVDPSKPGVRAWTHEESVAFAISLLARTYARSPSDALREALQEARSEAARLSKLRAISLARR